MSRPLFHASLSFAISAVFLKLDGQMGQLAFLAALMSVLMDLDATLSPTKYHETCLHSAAFLMLTLALLPLLMAAEVPLSISALPSIACVAHLAQDILQGEEVRPGVLTQLIDVDRWHRPEIGRVLDLVSLPLALLAILA